MLTFVTQALSVKQLLHIEQSLTSVHDKYAAWLGLLSSLKSLVQYRDVFTAQRGPSSDRNIISGAGVFMIGLYLLSATVLELIAPRLAFVELGDLARPQTLDLVNALDHVGNNASL